MTDSPTYDLLSRGRAAAKAGEKAEARRYLERMLNLDPPLDERMEALYWLSEVSADPREQRELLETILANNLGDARARRKLAILDGKIRPEEIVDPDRAAAALPGDPQAAGIRAFTCPKCGGRMTYTPDGHSLACEFCESRQQIAAGQAPAEDDFLVAMVTAKAQHRPLTAQSVICSGCSAAFILPPEVITQTCPYCQTPYAVEQVEVRTLDAPDSILPFGVSADQARAALRGWLRAAAPQGEFKVSRPRGIYLPVWLFNVGGQVGWSAWVYRNKTRVPLSGSRAISLANLLAPAANRLSPGLVPALNGFDLDALQPYDPRLLAGIPAETFQISAAAASLEVRRQAQERLTREMRQDEIEQPVEDFQLRTTHMLVEGYRLALLPLWLMIYVDAEHSQRHIEVAVNGQTGALTGEKPERGLFGWVKELF